jgi:serine/threonine protein kinase
MPVVRAASATQQPLLKQRYQLLKTLGVGGYGIVHKASDTEFGGRLVAIKEMSQAKMDRKDRAAATEAFKREAYMLAALTNPNLPSIYDYFTENGRWYLVMSYIEGETLEAYLNRSLGGRLPVEKVLMIGSQLASVLSYLHKRNPPIIFRDLKPSNIMRTPEGQIYLIDFGIARHFKVGQPKDTIALGSPGYAAPEQYGRAQSTPQTDVYSLGATLHYMLTGIDPSDTPFNLAPLDLPHYPQLSILITCMLDMDPLKRPASMGNIKRELQRISSGRSYSPGIPPCNQPRPYILPQPSSHVPGVRGLWQALFNSPIPPHYTPERPGMRHN